MSSDSRQIRAGTEVSDLRGLAYSIAYRMLGSVSESEDIVQEAFLRYHRAEGQGVQVESPRAYLAAVTTRLAIDYLQSARVRRESYVGEWLPEPVVDEREPAAMRSAEMNESLSMAFLLLLETLSPVERAVFLLREVFDYRYDEISRIVERSEENCRQLFVRSKRHIEERKPRFEVSPEKREALAQEFFAACEQGNLEELVRLLAADAVFHGDGGGKAAAVLQAVHGKERVGALMSGIFSKVKPFGVRAASACINGQPGVRILDSEGRLISIMVLEIADGRVRAIHSVINPEKLAHLGPVSPLARLPDRSGTVKEASQK